MRYGQNNASRRWLCMNDNIFRYLKLLSRSQTIRCSQKMIGLEHINGNKDIIFVQGFNLQLSGIKQAKMQAVNQKLNISKMM
jgi:hypothetical protein